jgi:hypothetical protein
MLHISKFASKHERGSKNKTNQSGQQDNWLSLHCNLPDSSTYNIILFFDYDGVEKSDQDHVVVKDAETLSVAGADTTRV